MEGLGHAFLLRNYRADLGKQKSAKGKHLRSPTAILKPMCDFTHVGARIGIPRRSGNGQTADPLGHPDGWNNFAYCNGRVTSAVDWMGGVTFNYLDKNNGNQSVSNSKELKPSDSILRGGRFDVECEYLIEPNGQITVDFKLALFISNEPNFFKESSSVPVDGPLAYYGPHIDGSGVDAFFGGNLFPVEVLEAHEYAHADAFFGALVDHFRKTLGVLEKQQQPATIAQVDAAFSAAVTASGIDTWAANDATTAAFLKNKWKKETVGGVINGKSYEIWKRKE